MPSARVRIAATKQTSADTWSSNVWSGTSPVAERVLLAAETNPVEVELKPLGYDADDAIVVLAGFNYIEVKGEFTQCKYKTHNAGSHGTIYIVSFYTDLAI